MKLKKHYSFESEGGNGADAIAIAETDSFDSWVIPEEGIEGIATGDESNTPDPAKPAAEGAAAKEKGAPSEKDKPPGEKTTEGNKPEGEEAEAEGSDSGELPVLGDNDSAEQETTWEEAATRFALPEIEDKNLQGEEKFAAQIKQFGASEYERGKQEVQEIDMKRFAPEAQAFISALNSGMKYEDVVKPAAAFYEAASGSNRELVLDYHIAVLGQTKEIAEDQVAVQEANETLDIKAAEIRTTLLKKAEQVVNENVKKYSDQYAQEQTRIKKETERENQKVANEINNRTEFMGGKLNPEAKKQLIKRWESGQYKNLMKNDEKSVVEFILWNEYGEAQLKKMGKTIETKVKTDVFNRLSNSSKGEGSSQQGGQSVAVDDFSAWENARPTGIEHG